MWKWTRRILQIVIVLWISILMFSNSGMPSLAFDERVRIHTRFIEFDYISWMLDALWRKAAQAALGSERFLTSDQQQVVIQHYIDLVNENRDLKSKINQIYADPNIRQPQEAAAQYLQRQHQVLQEMNHVGFLAESVLQLQLADILAASGLTAAGQPLPPLQYHTTPLPYALIVSPRDVIRQDADISLLPDLTLDEIVALEEKVEKTLNVSALVVPVGGVGVYPTMVMETSDLPWLAEVVSHEWIHNFLTLRPLGMLYDESPELRIINETAASIAGKELGSLAVENYYPQYLPEPVAVKPQAAAPQPVEQPTGPAPFDFRAAMHETRVTVDALLTAGKIEEAEAYMEERRQLILENGYLIRKLNQAYFAFHGAYADSPGGAAGEDPVGAAVRDLRAQSPTLESFLRKIAWVTSFEKLQELVIRSK
jgi:hypothetical protein